MNYYNKYKKYKGKYQQLGGIINKEIYSPVADIIKIVIPSDEIEYAKSLLNQEVEYCGKYIIKEYFSNTNICVLMKHEDVNSGCVINNRPNCSATHKGRYGILWHTHPDNSKFYPSKEDLLTLKKIRSHGSSIRLSIIYSSVGIWLLKSTEHDIKCDDLENIRKINNKLYYFNNNRGLISNFTEEIYDYLLSTYIPEINKLGFDINFIRYYDICDIKTIVTNIRKDSLEP